MTVESNHKIENLLWRFPATPLVLYVVLFLMVSRALFYCGALVLPLNSSYGPFPGVLTESINAIASVGTMWLIYRFIEHRSFSRSGLTLEPKRALLDVSCGFLLGFLLVFAMVLALYLSHTYTFIKFDSTFNATLPLLIFFIAALTEEVVFRLYTFQILETRIGTRWAFAISCFLFGLAHIINSVSGAPVSEKLYGCFCLVFEAGILLMAAYLVRRTVWLPLGLHWAWNFFEGPVFGMSVSGNILGSPMIKSGLDGPFLLTGGPFGPEASLAGLLLGTASGVALLLYAVKYGKWNSADEQH